MISATALIAKHLGVSGGVAVFVKYAAIIVMVVTPLWIMKSGYDENLIRQGYDECQLEYSQVVDEEVDVIEDVTEEREVVIQEGKTEQRAADTVTRERYNDLKREKDHDRIRFERLLQDAIARQPSDTGDINCAVERMPSELQRRARD